MWALPWVPALGMRQVSLEPCAEQDGGCVQSQWIEPYRCPNLYRRGQWAMLGNLPSDRPEFLRLLQVSQGSQAACHWFGGSIGGTECNRLIHPGFCPKHGHQGLQTLNSLQPGHKQTPIPHPISSPRGREDSEGLLQSPNTQQQPTAGLQPDLSRLLAAGCVTYGLCLDFSEPQLPNWQMRTLGVSVTGAL